jgi:hypothetical protein
MASHPFSSPPPLIAGGPPGQPKRCYVDQLTVMKERELNTLYVDFEHLIEHDQVRAMI